MDELIFDSNKKHFTELMWWKYYKFKAGRILQIRDIALTSAPPLGLPYCKLPMGQIFVVTVYEPCSKT